MDRSQLGTTLKLIFRKEPQEPDVTFSYYTTSEIHFFVTEKQIQDCLCLYFEIAQLLILLIF